MQYISPFALLQTLTPGQADKQSLALAKKKMLAELELNGGAVVTINGNEFTKNDIVNFFDNLQQTGNLSFHIIVANDAVLLRFLEQHFLNNGDRFSNNELYADAGFIEWVSPYFFKSFTRFAEKCLPGKDDSGWVALFSNPVLMNSLYTEQAWQIIENIVRKDLANLYSFLKSKGSRGIHSIKKLIDSRYTLMLQQLPVSRFTDLRNEYGAVMMHCSIPIFNGGNKAGAMETIENAWRLAVTRELKDHIQAKQAEMDHILRTHREAGKAGGWLTVPTTWRVVIIVIIIVLKFATCASML